MYVGWSPVETGAPEIDPKRPYGNSNVERDIYALLDGGPWDEDHGMPAALSPQQWADRSAGYSVLHRSTATALQVILTAGSFEPGTYETPRYFTAWVRVDA